MRRLGLVLALMAGSAFGQGVSPSGGASLSGVTTNTTQTITGAKTFSATLTAGTISATTVGATTGNITTVAATTVGATTGNITTVNSTAVATSTVAASGKISSTVAGASEAAELTTGAYFDYGGNRYILSNGTLIQTSHSFTPWSDLGANLGSASYRWAAVYTNGLLDNGSNVRLGTGNGAAVGNTYMDAASAPASGTIAHAFATKNTYVAGGELARFNNVGAAKATINFNGYYTQPAQTATVADDGAGTSPATAITPTSNLVLLAYNDADNASIGSINETDALEGSVVRIVHTGSGGSVDFAEAAGVLLIGTTCTLNLSDVLEVVYANSAWHAVSCKDN